MHCVCLSVTNLLVSFHVNMTHYAYLLGFFFCGLWHTAQLSVRHFGVLVFTS